MTILTTSACDAKCAHCLMRSAPERDDTLRLADIVGAVSAAHRASPLHTVVFAGGEPTLLGDTLIDAIAEVSSLGIATRLVTNAGWAEGPEQAAAVIAGLREAGLDEINFSADDFHLRFIPLSNVVTAWRATKGAGFQSVVIALCSGPGSKVTPATLMAELGEDVPLIYDDGGNMQPMPPASADGTTYLISNNLVYRIGRGRGLREKYVQFPDDLTRLDRPCPWAVGSAAVSAQNHLVACCGIEAEHNAVLDFGKLDESAVPELVSRANADPLVMAISQLGPAHLMRRAQQLDPTLEFRPRYSAICEICEDVTTNPQAVAVLRKNSELLRSDVTGTRIGVMLARQQAEAETADDDRAVR